MYSAINTLSERISPVQIFIIDNMVDTGLTVTTSYSGSASARKISRPINQIIGPIFNPNSQTAVMQNYYSDYEETETLHTGYRTAYLQYSSDTIEPLIRSAIHINVDCTFTLNFTLENSIYSAKRSVGVTVVDGEISLGDITTVTTYFYGLDSTTYKIKMYLWATNIVFT